MKKWVATLLLTLTANELTNFLVLVLKFIELVVIGAIDWLLDVGIGGVPDKISLTHSKVGIDDPMISVTNLNLHIEPYRQRLPSVTEYPRLKTNTIFYIFI